MCRGEFQAGCRLAAGLVLCSLSLSHAAGFNHANTQWSSAPRHTLRHQQAVSKVKLPPAVLTVTAAFMYGTYEDPFVYAYEEVRRRTIDRTIMMHEYKMYQLNGSPSLALGMQNWALGAMRGALAPSEFKPAPSESDAKIPLTNLVDAGRVLYYYYYLDFDGGYFCRAGVSPTLAMLGGLCCSEPLGGYPFLKYESDLVWATWMDEHGEPEDTERAETCRAETCRILVGQVEDNLANNLETGVKRQNIARVGALLDHGSPAEKKWAQSILILGPLSYKPTTLEWLRANYLSFDYAVKFLAMCAFWKSLGF